MLDWLEVVSWNSCWPIILLIVPFAIREDSVTFKTTATIMDSERADTTNSKGQSKTKT